jgi:divalent metal cation (Fe/Co/Zn/Cd) transporter
VTQVVKRQELLVRARRLEYLTLAWNGLEALVALLAGVLSGSVALVGFGLDSVIECASAVVVLWRVRRDVDVQCRERAERRAQQLIGVSFLLLALYVTIESLHALWTHAHPERSVAGVVIAAAAVIVMPLLGKAKRRIAVQLASGALHSDSRQADFCAYLSGILLAGLVLNHWAGWWWADSAAALVMVPIIAREGVAGVRGRKCECG